MTQKEEENSQDLSPTEEEPIKNLFFMLALIPIAPLILLYYFVLGKRQNSFILGAGLSVIMTVISVYSLVKYSESQENENVVLVSMVEELSLEQKQDLKESFSTLRKSIGENKLPEALHPMLDIQQNMLTINYYNYLANANQIGENGAGAILILQNTLYGEDRLAANAAWQCLFNIGTDDAKIVMSNYSSDVVYANKRQEELDRIQANHRVMPDSGGLDLYKKKFRNKIKILKNKL